MGSKGVRGGEVEVGRHSMARPYLSVRDATAAASGPRHGTELGHIL